MGKRKFPPRVTASHGALYYIEDLAERNAKGKPKQKWHYLCRAEDGPAMMHEALASLHTDRQHLPCSLAGVIDSWRKDVMPKRYAEKTRDEYDRMCDVIADKIECNDVADLRPVHIAQFIDEWFGDKHNAARKYKQLLSLLMQHAVRKGYRDNDPAAEVSMSGYEIGGRSRYLTDDEIQRIRAGAIDGPDPSVKGRGGRKTRSGDMIVCLIDLLLITGQRVGDVLRLTWADVSDDGILFRPSKVAKSTGAQVPVKMTPQLRAVLDRAKAIGKVKGMHVIHTMRGQAYTYHGVYSAWSRACDRASPKVENANIHDLRHRSLTDAKAQGKNAQGLGGHADEKMTQQYIERPEIEWLEPPSIAVVGGRNLGGSP